MCMAVAGGATDDGALIVLATCDGGEAQKFTLRASGELVNPRSTKCVSVVEGSTDYGSRLWTWTCTGASHQLWRR